MWGLMRALLLVCQQLSLLVTWQGGGQRERKKAGGFSACKGPNPINGAPPSWSDRLPQAWLPGTITSGMGLHHVSLEGTHPVHSSPVCSLSNPFPVDPRLIRHPCFFQFWSLRCVLDFSIHLLGLSSKESRAAISVFRSYFKLIFHLHKSTSPVLLQKPPNLSADFLFLSLFSIL